MDLYIMKIFLLVLLFLICNCQSKSILNLVKKQQTEDTKNKTEVDIDVVNAINPEIGDVAPPNHLDAVKLGRDGKINSNFHKEVFLGEDVENFEKLTNPKKKLKEIFHVIDVDNDKYINAVELSKWVFKKTMEHFEEAKHENKNIFVKLDTNKNGKLSWNEYLVEFLTQRGFDRASIVEKLYNKIKIEINQSLSNDVEDTRDKWFQAASEGNSDFLTVEEFLDFQHPEQSRSSLTYMVEGFMHDMDANGDNVINVREYMAVPPDVDVEAQADEWAVQRREEFRKIIDQNHDGNVTKEELTKYLDPLSENMVEHEARQLISFGDMNEDGKLSLDELLDHSEFYTGSKLYNYAQSVHEEF